MGGYIREGFKHEWYLRYALLDQERTAQATAAFIAAMIEDGIPIDAIAFTGMSGALVAPRVASLLDLPLLMVRKAHDGSHSAYKVEGFVESQCYVIVDDFVCTGTTVEAICERIAAAQRFLPERAMRGNGAVQRTHGQRPRPGVDGQRCTGKPALVELARQVCR